MLLAVASHWKVYYFTAEMADHPEYRAEEAEFLENMFEANATMVVPPPESDERWDYRRRPVENIYAAVRRMLLERAQPSYVDGQRRFNQLVQEGAEEIPRVAKK